MSRANEIRLTMRVMMAFLDARAPGGVEDGAAEERPNREKV